MKPATAERRPAAGRRGWRRVAAAAAVTLIGAAVVVVVGARPAAAGPFGCPNPPRPEAPGLGFTGFVDPHRGPPPPQRDPFAKGSPASIYAQYGYAGFTFHNYDLRCIFGTKIPTADNSLANMLMTGATWMVAVTNTAHQWVTSQGALAPLDPLVTKGSQIVRDALFEPWLPVSLAVLALWMVARTRDRDLPSAASAVGWSVVVVTLVAGLTQYPTWASDQADRLVGSAVARISSGFAQETGTGRSQAALLVDTVLYQQWLRGTFGDPDSPAARQYGAALFKAQTLTRHQTALPPEQRRQVIKEKMKRWETIAGKVEKRYPVAYQHLTGRRSAVGAGAIAVVTAMITCLFQLIASWLILAALVAVRVVVILAPALAVVALHPSLAHILTGVLKSMGAALVGGVIFSAAAGAQAVATRLLLGGGVEMATALALVLLAALTVLLWKLTKPIRSVVRAFGAEPPSGGKLAKGLLAYAALRQGTSTGAAAGSKRGMSKAFDDAETRAGAGGDGSDGGRTPTYTWGTPFRPEAWSRPKIGPGPRRQLNPPPAEMTGRSDPGVDPGPDPPAALARSAGGRGHDAPRRHRGWRAGGEGSPWPRPVFHAGATDGTPLAASSSPDGGGRMPPAPLATAGSSEHRRAPSGSPPAASGGVSVHPGGTAAAAEARGCYTGPPPEQTSRTLHAHPTGDRGDRAYVVYAGPDQPTAHHRRRGGDTGRGEQG